VKSVNVKEHFGRRPKSNHFDDNKLDGNKMERNSKNKTGSVLEVEVGQTKGLATALEHFVPTNQTQLAENNAGENPRSRWLLFIDILLELVKTTAI
jgi:hypothetical protein